MSTASTSTGPSWPAARSAAAPVPTAASGPLPGGSSRTAGRPDQPRPDLDDRIGHRRQGGGGPVDQALPVHLEQRLVGPHAPAGPAGQEQAGDAGPAADGGTGP